MALDPLVTTGRLSARLQAELGTNPTRAEALLVDASAAVRGYTGQDFTAGTSTGKILRPKNGYVRLPQRPVTAVDAVVDVNDNPVLYTWDGLDRVSVSANVPDSFAWEPWRDGITTVKVTYDHGYDEIPDDIVGVVCNMVARALGRPAEETGVTQEAIAGYSYSVGSAAGAGPFGMLADERAVLDRYAHPQIGSFTIAL